MKKKKSKLKVVKKRSLRRVKKGRKKWNKGSKNCNKGRKNWKYR